jgi:UDP:flavonoid glycosyltransferase YjiC (YdhE family)
LTEDKEKVSAHVQWAGVGIDLHTNEAQPHTGRHAAREILDRSSYRTRAQEMAREFASRNAKESLLRLIEACVREHRSAKR